MLKVVIIGYGEMFTNLIAGALDANCEIVGVLRNEMRKYHPFIRKIKDIINPSRDYSYIKSYNLQEIKAYKGVNSREFRKAILKLNPDIILVGSWCEKFSKETYSMPKIATINAHPSLLPKYRGPNPYYWVIKNQENETGITFHLMDDKYDNGAILSQEIIKIYPTDTGKTLKERTVLTARGVVSELLNVLSDDVVIPLQQREEQATYYSHPDEFKINFKKNAEEIYANIRANYPWNKTFFYHKTTALTPNPYKITIEENHTNFKEFGTIIDIEVKTKTLAILCGNNKIIKMSDINLYNDIDKAFTKYYIKRDIKIGDLII